MTNIVTFLSGKKTYIIAALMVALGCLQGNSDQIFQGLAFAGLRLGIEKNK